MLTALGLAVLLTAQAQADDAGTRTAGGSWQVVPITPAARDRLAPDRVGFSLVAEFSHIWNELRIDGPLDRDRLTRDACGINLGYLINF